MTMERIRGDAAGWRVERMFRASIFLLFGLLRRAGMMTTEMCSSNSSSAVVGRIQGWRELRFVHIELDPSADAVAWVCFARSADGASPYPYH